MLYRITDSYGTNRYTLGLQRAYAWLPYCSPHATITNALTRRIVAFRAFVRTY